MKYDQKNMFKLQVSTYLEESLSMVGKMMLQDIFNSIDVISEDEAKAFVEAHFDDNIFELIAPYVQKASEEYEIFRRSPEGQSAFAELNQIMNEIEQTGSDIEKLKVIKKDNNNEGNGNVH